jgi:hypothetical protein
MKKSLVLLFTLIFLNSCGGTPSNYQNTTSYSSSSNFVSDQSFINNKLSNRALSSIEGIWTYSPGGRKIGIYKSGDYFIAQVLKSGQIPIGAQNFKVEQTSNTDYFGSYYLYDNSGRKFEGYTEISTRGSSGSASIMIVDSQGYKRSKNGDGLVRSWPYNLASHNAEYNTGAENKIIADVNFRAQDECLKLGFTEGTQDLANCKLKLVSLYKKEAIEEQKIKIAQEQTKMARRQEMAAKKQATAQQQIAYQAHQKNSNALKQQGMKMLTGQCTLGIDC